MSMKIQIQSVHFDADQSLKSFINKKLTKLETFYDKIIDSDVVLSLEQLNTQVRDKVVVIKTNIPGSTIIAKEKSKKFIRTTAILKNTYLSAWGSNST